MSLAGQVSLLATRIGAEIKSVRSVMLQSLAVGTVTTGAAGSNAAVTIAGTAPTQTINFTIPQGAAGTVGAAAVTTSTSTTSMTIGTGSFVITTATALTLPVGQTVRIWNTGTPANYMVGQITAISGTSVTVSVTEIGGSGTLTAWTIAIGAFKGAVGSTGPTGQGLIAGGATGDVLRKASATDYATSWSTPTSASTASALMVRDANGRASVADPSLSTDIATKNYVDTKAPSLSSNFTNQDFGVGAPGQVAFTAANGMYFVPVRISGNCTITGIRFKKGTGVTAANVIGALYNSSGTLVANSATAGTAEGTTAGVVVTCAFTAAYTAAPGLYYMAIIGSSTSADFYGWTTTNYLGPAQYAAQASFVVPASFTPVASTTLASVSVPQLATY